MRGGMARELIGLNMAGCIARSFGGSRDRSGASFDMHISLYNEIPFFEMIVLLYLYLYQGSKFVFPLQKKINLGIVIKPQP